MNNNIRVLCMILSGELIVYAHTTYGLLACIALAPWCCALLAPNEDSTPLHIRHALLLSFLPYAIASLHMWGLREFGGMIHAASSLYLPLAGVFFALFSRPAHRLPLGHPTQTLLLASAWTLADATRGFAHIGFPALLGSTLADLPILAQTASITGPWGLDFFVGLTNALSAQLLLACLHHPRHSPPKRRLIFAIIALFTAVTSFGALRLHQAPLSIISTHQTPPSAQTQRVTLLQTATPNWAHRRAWMLQHLQDAVDANTRDLIARAYSAHTDPTRPHWVILPESSFGRALPNPAKLTQTLQTLLPPNPPPNTTLFLTATTLLEASHASKPQADRSDTMWVLTFPSKTDTPNLVDNYSKHLLVPMAERRYLPGPGPHLLETPQGPIGPLICYESLFPQVARSHARSGAKALVVSTNDAGQRWSTAAQWHARLGRLRAIETGLPLFHASQGGPSFAVDPYGRQTSPLGLFERGSRTVYWTPHTTKTLYRSLGIWVLLAPAFLWLITALWTLSRIPNSNKIPEEQDPKHRTSALGVTRKPDTPPLDPLTEEREHATDTDDE